MADSYKIFFKLNKAEVNEDMTKFLKGNKADGFTLYELMIALAIGGILIVIGIPSLNQILSAQKTHTQINEFIATIREAKATALTLNTQTLIIPTGGNYTNGWQMGLDNNTDGSIDTVMRISQDADQLIFTSSPNLTFTNGGRITPVLFSISPLSCNDVQNPKRDISIGLAGHIDITNCNCDTGPPCP